MNLESMSYKGYTWKYNPKRLEINQVRNIKEHTLPFVGNIYQDFGNKKRIVKGIGEFFGEDCVEQYNELKTVFDKGGSGYLSIPSINSFLAIFYSLDLVRKSEPNVIEYSFEFWEEIEENTTASLLRDTKYHSVEAGETMWSIAYKYGISVSKLRELNPEIKRPEDLSKIESVKIS